MSEKIREMLRKAVRESSSHGPDVQFQDDTPILADGIIDSLGIFSVMTELETAFGFTFPPEELVADNFQSVDTMELLVRRLTESGTIARETVE